MNLDSQRSSVDAKGKIIGLCGKKLLAGFRASSKNPADISMLSTSTHGMGNVRSSLNFTGTGSVFKRKKPRNPLNDSVIFDENKDYESGPGGIDSNRQSSR